MNNKQIVEQFLKLVVSNKVDEAYEKYIDMAGKHHNMYFPAGFEVLKNAMKESDKKFPKKTFAIKHIIEENDLVLTHSHIILDQKPGMVVAHMFRIKNAKIIEMWDWAQEIPSDVPNKDGVF